MVDDFGLIVGSIVIITAVVYTIIIMGGPQFRLLLQVISFAAHRLGIFRKLPGGWHAPIPRTSGITCTLNCQACELAWLGCPVGMLQQYVINFRAPFYVFGIILGFGTALGRAICGWLCPFGLILDTCNKVCTHKYRPPDKLRFVKYFFIGAVVLGAVFTGTILWCRFICFGALLGAVPYWLTWQTVSTFWMVYHLGLFAFYFTFSYFTHGRAWCRYFCPLGAFFSLLNPFSLIKRRYDWKWCTKCDRCKDICPMGLDPTKDDFYSKIDCIKCGRCAKVCKSNALSVTQVFGAPWGAKKSED